MSFTITSQITVDGDITVESINGPEVTIVDAQTYSRVFEISNGATLSGLTITWDLLLDGGVFRSRVLSSAVNDGGGVWQRVSQIMYLYMHLRF